MPRYEYTEGSSRKFWEVALDGATVTTRFGRIGAAGQQTLKKLGTAAAAQKEYRRLIESKKKKGYLPADEPAAASASKQRAAAAPQPAEAVQPKIRRPPPAKATVTDVEPLGGAVPWAVGARINGIAWAPCGEVLAAVGASRCRLFNLVGELLAELDGPTGYAYDATFSPDSSLLAVGFHGGHLVLYDADTGKRVRELKGHGGVPNGVRKLRFSPDGKLLASAGSDCTLRVWDVKKGKQLVEHREPEDVNGVDWFPDGQRLAFCTDAAVGIYDLAKKKRTALAAKSGSADVLVLDGGATVVADGCASTLGILIFDDKLKLKRKLAQRDACRLSLGADGSLLAASWQGKDRGVSRWDLRTRRRTRLAGHEDSAVWALAVHPQTGEVAVAGDHGRVYRWSKDGQPLTASGAKAHSKEIEWLTLSPARDRLYSASSDGAVIAWQLPDAQPLMVYRIPGSSGTEGVAVSADGRTVFATGFSGVAAFDAATGETRWHRKTDRVRRVLVLDETTLVMTLDQRLVWVDARTGEPRHLGRPTAGNWSINFVERLPDGRLVTGEFLGGRDLSLWDPAQREVVATLPLAIDGTHGLYDMIQLADGRLLLSAADGTLRLVDAQARGEKQLYQGKRRFDRLAISPDGRRLVAAADDALAVLSFPGMDLVREIKMPFKVRALEFLDQRQVVAGGEHGQLSRVRC